MLRVKQGVPAGPPPPEEAGAPPPLPPPEAEAPPLPPEAPPSAPPEAPGGLSKDLPVSFQKLPQPIAVYRSPDQGPFQCSNCDYWEQDGSCTLVDGAIDPEGFCNMFMQVSGHPEDAPDVGGEAPEEPLPEEEEEPLPEEVPKP